MVKIGRPFFAMLITMSTVVLGNATSKRTLVEFWHTGDDGLSQKLADQVERALARSPDFSVSAGRKSGTLIVTIPTNVEWKQIGKRTQVLYHVEFSSVDSDMQSQTKGSCWEDRLSDCANQIVKATRIAAQKLPVH